MYEVIMYSCAAGAITLVGSALVIRNRDSVKKYTQYLISFAAGVMMSTVFLHLLPEASEASPHTALVWALAGFIAFYVIENFIMFHPCADETCEIHRLGAISFVGLFIHSLLDGVAIAVGFEVAPAIGFFTAISVILHEFPEGISISGILLHAGETRRKIITLSALVALATPAGAALFSLWSPRLDAATLSALLSLTAGSFVYIAATDLIPEAHKKNNRLVAAAFLFGVALVAAGEYFMPEH